MTEKVITIKDVEYTADLARIEMTAEELKKMTEDLNGVLAYFKDLQEADTSAVKKVNHYEMVEGERNHFREDEVEPAKKEVEGIIKDNFPERSGDFLAVRSVLNKK